MIGFRLACVLLLAATACAAGEKEAQRDTVYQLSPVIVTATQAKERQSPVTFSNLTSRELRDRYSVQDIPVLLSELPSITTYSENGNGIGYNYINLRGFDQRRISVMINGVPQNDPEDHNVYWLDFPDLLASTDNIQVQRGAGSAFYGPPAIGGSVNLVTNPFRHEPSITFEAMAGFQEFGDSSKSLALNTRKYAVSVNSGLVADRYMLYGRLGTILSDGYRTNAFVDFDSYFLGAIRFDENMSTRVHFFGGPIADGLAYYGLPKFVNENKKLRRQNLNYWEVDSTGTAYSYVQPRRSQEVENFTQPHYELIHDWKISSTAILHNTLFYYTGDGFFDYDASWADTSMLRLGTQYGIPVTANPTNTLVRAYVGNRQWGWLPRVEFDHGSGSLTIGAEVRFHRSTHWGKIQFAEGLPQNFDPDYHFYEYNGEKDILSLYVHELYRLDERTTLMGDLQIVRNRYGIKNEKYLGNRFSLPYVFVNPRLGVNHNFDDHWSGYLSLAYTSREPRLRNLYAAEDAWFGATPQFKADTTGGRVRYDFDEPLAKPERLFNVEIGARYSSDGISAGVNVYWMEFSDELVKSGQVDIFGQPVTGNAERTRHIGLELEGRLNIAESFTLTGNFTLSRNRLVRYKIFDDNGNPMVLDNNPIAGFPDVLGNLRLTYRSEDLMVSVLTKYVGSFYTDNFKNEANKNDAYVVSNAEMSYALPEWNGVRLTLRGE
ncbi:MAG TPA: TonB-dependent receptor, partial [Bacteroidota bacterium]|nr:TonB-dependent receptor [Bacteroidota bacterium]